MPTQDTTPIESRQPLLPLWEKADALKARPDEGSRCKARGEEASSPTPQPWPLSPKGRGYVRVDFATP